MTDQIVPGPDIDKLLRPENIVFLGKPQNANEHFGYTFFEDYGFKIRWIAVIDLEEPAVDQKETP